MGKKIHEEIQQKAFRNHQQEVQLNIIFTSAWLQSKHAAIFKKYSLSSQQYNVLRILRGALPEEVSLGTIKSRMVDRMSDTSRIVERLHKTGLIKRTTDQTDRRISKITISEKGLMLLSEVDKEESTLDSLTSNLTNEEATTLSNLLNKMRDC